MEYNLDVADDDNESDCWEDVFVNNSVADSSSVENFEAMALHVLSNISSTTPTIGNVVVMHIPMGTHSLFFLPSLPLALLEGAPAPPPKVWAKSSCVGSIPTGAGT